MKKIEIINLVLLISLTILFIYNYNKEPEIIYHKCPTINKFVLDDLMAIYNYKEQWQMADTIEKEKLIEQRLKPILKNIKQEDYIKNKPLLDWCNWVEFN